LEKQRLAFKDYVFLGGEGGSLHNCVRLSYVCTFLATRWKNWHCLFINKDY